MTRDEILDALCKMLPGQLDLVVAKLAVPPAILHGEDAPQSMRAAEVVQYLEGQQRLGELSAVLRPGAAVGAQQVSIARLAVTGRELFGREEELGWLDKCWDGGVRVASVVALDGVGKSALVNAWLRGMSERGWRGAERVFGWSVNDQGSVGEASSDAFVDAALRWFGDANPSAGSPWDKGERLAGLVEKQRTILVLDGVTPLLDKPEEGAASFKDPALGALVKELCAQGSALCLLTSAVHVADLGAWLGVEVQEKELAHLAPAAGAKLLAAQGAVGLEEDLERASAEYGGHALSLTLLGRYLRNAYKGDIYRRHDVATLGGAPVQAMMATYERLLDGAPELGLLRLLGLFDRPAQEEEIQALLAPPVVPGLNDGLVGLADDAWNGILTALRDLRLLADDNPEEEGVQLDVHPLVRAYFGDKLQKEHPEAWKQGHGRLYEHLKKSAKELPETLEEMAPLHAAVVHGCRSDQHTDALQNVYVKRIQRGKAYFQHRMLGARGVSAGMLAGFFVRPWDPVTPNLSPVDQGWVTLEAAQTLLALGRLDEATMLFRKGLDLAKANADARMAAINAGSLTEILLEQGRIQAAEQQAREAIALADGGPAPKPRIFTRSLLAAALHAAARGPSDPALAEAESVFVAAEAIEREHEPEHAVLVSIRGYRFNDLLLDQGRLLEVFVRAVFTLRSAIRGRVSILGVAVGRLTLGRAHLAWALANRARGKESPRDFSRAARSLTRAVDGLREGNREHLPLALLARADLHTHTRAFDGARADLDEALSLATLYGFRLYACDAHLGHGRLALAQNAPAAARPHIEAARALLAATGYHRRDAELADLDAACR